MLLFFEKKKCPRPIAFQGGSPGKDPSPRVPTGFGKVWKSMEFDLSIFQVWKSMEKRKQSMEKYVFPDFCPYLFIFIIEN